MTKKIVIHEEYCIGCRLCEVYCLVAHSESKKIIKVFKDEIRFREATPKIVFEQEQEGYTSFALTCRNCEDAPCIEACMTGALYRDEKTGAVVMNEDKCVGCYMCIMACPYGVIKRDTKKGKIVSKCDLCVGTGEEIPACVAHCPNEALTLEDVPDEKELNISINDEGGNN
ncbi:MAG: 4Fe-4S dicluster domain-containing protein [Promethearchaeota archaeon]